MTTWNQLHVGDVVRGADGGAWEVIGRTPGPRWVTRGPYDTFELRNAGRTVTTSQKLTEPAPAIHVADHTEQAHAWQALAEQFQLVYLGESMTDQFDSPAEASDGMKRDRYGRYVLPHPSSGVETAFTRVTTLARTLSDEWGLTQWKLRCAVKGVAMREDLRAGAAAADLDQDKGTLNSIASQAMDAAGGKRGANFGTAFHQGAQRLDRGEALETMQLPEAMTRDLAAYQAALKAYRLRVAPEYMERTVYVPDLEVCGTFDRLLHQPPGHDKRDPLAIGDLKSAKDLEYSWLEIEIQMACYANATHVWNKATKSWDRMPEGVDKTRAIVMHSPIGKGQTLLYGVDLVRGWKVAQRAAQVREDRKAAKGWLINPDPVSLALHLVSQAASQQELAALWDRFHPAGHWTDETQAAAAARWEQIHTPATV